MKEKKPQKKSWLYYYGIILLLLVVLNSVVFPAFYKMSGKVEEVVSHGALLRRKWNCAFIPLLGNAATSGTHL